jgi:hypothetical protein
METLMPLTSSRFRNDPQLQACAVNDSDHLLRGMSGVHIALVQQALLDLGEHLPVFGADGIFEAETEKAVIDYKTARNILNTQNQIDGIVGTKTIARLDTDIDTFDATPGLCPPDVDGPAVALNGADQITLNALLGGLGGGQLIDVDSAGSSRLILGAAIGETMLSDMVSAAVGALGGGGDPALSRLTNTLTNLIAAPPLSGFSDIPADLSDGIVAVASLDTGPALVEGLLQLVQAQALSGIPARDLSSAAAVAEAIRLHQAGVISLTPPPTFDAQGNPTSPRAGDKLSVIATLASVQFLFVNFADRTKANYLPSAVPLLALDSRHLVGLARLALRFSTGFGVTEIHHVGIGGQAAGGTDCHTQGRACDLVGVRGVRSGQPFLLTVLNDWALHSVPNLANPAGPRRPDWPHSTAASLVYRLETDPKADPLARELFQDLYIFAATEYQDKSSGPGQATQASTIGQVSFVMTPDHPTSHPGKNGREAHRSHVHFQLGPTGSV